MDIIASMFKSCPFAIMSEGRAYSDKFMLRLPDGMRQQIKEAAEENGRSMNAEIISRLMNSFEQAEESRHQALDLFSDLALLMMYKDPELRRLVQLTRSKETILHIIAEEAERASEETPSLPAKSG